MPSANRTGLFSWGSVSVGPAASFGSEPRRGSVKGRTHLAVVALFCGTRAWEAARKPHPVSLGYYVADPYV